MNLAIGLSGIVLSLVGALSGIVAIIVGLRTSRKKLLVVGARYSWLVLGGMVIATFAMQRALITRDFTVKFVAEQGSSLTPPLFNVATMWSALEGSVLLWGLILAGYVVVVTVKFSGRYTDPMVAWALVVMFFVMGFSLWRWSAQLTPFNHLTLLSGMTAQVRILYYKTIFLSLFTLPCSTWALLVLQFPSPSQYPHS